MSVKWTHNETGILRKKEFSDKKEELFVFGYTCKLFRDDEKALHIDQGKHLIPWMGDETLKIDRYDARGALHELSRHEAPPGGFDWRVELTKTELDVEQLCDEERYRALHTDEDEEEMYKEEELKRLHKAGYGQVGFNYETTPQPPQPPQEVDEPFDCPPSLKALLPQDIVLPDTEKQHAIIEKTAKFIAMQGAQMEILIKAKQGDNAQFLFLNRDSILNPYYMTLIALVKAGKWPIKKVEVEEKPPENEEYLHPSLAAATVIESAPSIPSIQYKASADCDYRLLISNVLGGGSESDVAPPGTEPVHYPDMNQLQASAIYQQQYAAYYQQYMSQVSQSQPAQVTPVTTPPVTAVTPSEPKEPGKSTGLSLMKNYDTDSDSDSDSDSSTDSKKEPPIQSPPEEIKVVIDKMAAYVARNGDEFAEIVRAKNDPRFIFLEPDNEYHPYYKQCMLQKRGVSQNGADSAKVGAAAPVSFSIKKQKEPDPILPKPALPYESSSEDEDSEKTDKEKEKEEPKEQKETPKVNPTPAKTNIPLIPTMSNIPQAVVYKMEASQANALPVVRTVETVKKPVIIMPRPNLPPKVDIKELNTNKVEEINETVKKLTNFKADEPIIKGIDKSVTPTPDRDINEKKDKDGTFKRKRKHKDRKKEHRSRSHSRERRHPERDRTKKEYKKDKKRSKYSKDELESEIISLEDNSDEMIDLTGDQSDGKGDGEVERSKQLERRRRAAEFLKNKVGVDPVAALPTSSLASAMVDTLESLQKKKAAEEERRRRREKKKHHRSRHDYDDSERSHRRHKRRRNGSCDEDDSDYDSSKKRKKKKDRKHSSTKNKKKRRREDSVEEEQDPPLPLNIDLTNTLKGLRTASPTRNLVLSQETEENTQFSYTTRQDSSSDEEDYIRERKTRRDRSVDTDGEVDLKEKKGRKKKRKEDREYSEGEWSSDSEDDSASSLSKSGD